MKDGKTLSLPQGYKDVAQVVVGMLTVVVCVDSNGVSAEIYSTDEVALANGALSDEFLIRRKDGDISPMSTAHSFYHEAETM